MLEFTQAMKVGPIFWLIFVEDRIGLTPAATRVWGGERVVFFGIIRLLINEADI